VEVAKFRESQGDDMDFLDERYDWVTGPEIAKIENKHTYQGAMKYVYKASAGAPKLAHKLTGA